MYGIYIFNVTKCGVLHVGKSNPECPYFMKQNDSLEQIRTQREEKDLGVIFDINYPSIFTLVRLLVKRTKC